MLPKTQQNPNFINNPAEKIPPTKTPTPSSTISEKAEQLELDGNREKIADYYLQCIDQSKGNETSISEVESVIKQIAAYIHSTNPIESKEFNVYVMRQGNYEIMSMTGLQISQEVSTYTPDGNSETNKNEQEVLKFLEGLGYIHDYMGDADGPGSSRTLVNGCVVCQIVTSTHYSDASISNMPAQESVTCGVLKP